MASRSHEYPPIDLTVMGAVGIFKQGQVAATFRRCFDFIVEDVAEVDRSQRSKGDDLSKSGKWLAGVDENTNYEFAVVLRLGTPEPQKMRKRDRDRAEALRLAGGPPPSLRDRAVALARDRGEVRTRDLTDIGIPRCYLSKMCEEGLLVKVGYGRYRAALLKVA